MTFIIKRITFIDMSLSSIFGQNTVVATAFYGLIFKIYFSRYKAIGNCVKELQNNFVKPKLYESGFFGGLSPKATYLL